jgi:hypothetical protein
MELLQPGERPRPSPALAQRLERQVLAPARSIGEELSLVAITEPPPPVSVMYPPRGGTWLIAYHDSDPIAHARGGDLHAPEAEIKRLTQMHQAGVNPDVILVGHQQPGRWRPGDPVPPAYFAGEPTTVNRVLSAQAWAVESGLRLLRAALKAGAEISAGTAAGAAALGAAVLLDPVVAAGVREPRSGLIGWVPLGSWFDEQPA